MASGTLIYNKGLKGTQPVFISPGGSTATVLGDMEVPKLKFGGLKITGHSNHPTQTVYLTDYPKDILVSTSIGYSGYKGNNKSGSITIGDQILSNCFVRQNESYNPCRIAANWLVNLTSDANITFTGDYFGTYKNDSVNLCFEKIIKNSTEINKTNGTLTIKTDSSDLSNISSFSTWGTEFDATKYNKTKSRSDSDHQDIVITTPSSGNYYSYLVQKYENLSSLYSYLMPLQCIGFTNSDGMANNCLDIYIWNFNTSSWNAFSGLEVLGSQPPNGWSTLVGNYQYCPFGPSPLDCTDYISGGTSYIKLRFRYYSDGGIETGTFGVGYLGLLQLNLYGDNVNV